MKIELGRGMKMQQQISFYEQLAVILKSGLPLLDGLQLLAKNAAPRQALLCYRLQQSLRRGSSLSQAMAAEPANFGQLAVALVAAGEESGELGGIFQQLADYYERQQKLRRFVQQAVTYPAILLFAAVCVLIFFLLYILPVLADAYVSMGVKPAGTLALLLQIKSFLLAYPFFAAFGAVISLLLLFRIGNLLLQYFLRSRFSGNFHNLLLEVRFCRLLALLLDSGLSVTKAVDIAAAAIDDAAYVRQLQLLNSRLQRGVAIEQAAAGAQGIFSSLLLELVCVGASTGYLPHMLQQAVTAGEQKLQQQLDRLKQILVPLLLLLAAVIIAGIVCLVISPLFEMLSAMPE